MHEAYNSQDLSRGTSPGVARLILSGGQETGRFYLASRHIYAHHDNRTILFKAQLKSSLVGREKIAPWRDRGLKRILIPPEISLDFLLLLYQIVHMVVSVVNSGCERQKSILIIILANEIRSLAISYYEIIGFISVLFKCQS